MTRNTLINLLLATKTLLLLISIFTINTSIIAQTSFHDSDNRYSSYPKNHKLPFINSYDRNTLSTETQWTASSSKSNTSATEKPQITKYFSATPRPGNRILLQWEVTTINDIAHFEIYRSKDSKNWQLINMINDLEQTKFNMEDLLASSGTYYYQVKAIQHNTKHQLSPITTAKVEGNSLLKVYSNPNTRKISVTTNLAKNKAMLQVFDNNGQLKSEQWLDSNRTHLDVDHLPNGKYTIRVFNGQQMESTCFVKTSR